MAKGVPGGQNMALNVGREIFKSIIKTPKEMWKKSKLCRRKKIIKTIKMRKLLNPKVGSLRKKKINKTCKFLGRLFESQRKKEQITNVGRERVAITTNSISTKFKTRRY